MKKSDLKKYLILIFPEKQMKIREVLGE